MKTVEFRWMKADCNNSYFYSAIDTPQGVYVLASEVEERIQVLENALKLSQIELTFAPCRDNPEHTICLKCQAEKRILETIGDSGAVP